MKTVEIVGFKRTTLGKTKSKALRHEGQVPCVLYGKDTQVHFSVPMILFKDIVYTPEAHTVDLNVEGDTYKCILQEVQFHPVSEMILHADFFILQENKPVVMEIPIKLTGNAPGVQKGGKIIVKLRKIKIKSLPTNLPDFITIDISGLELGKSIKVGDLKQDKYTILNTPSIPVVSVQIPRAVKEETPAETAVVATPTATTDGKDAKSEGGKEKK